MPITLNGDTGIQTPMYNGTITANAVTPSVNMKNRIINGAMVIDQRNAGASVTASTGTYTLDRWRAYSSQASKFTVQQNAGSVTPPVGFTNYLGVTSSSAYSSGASDLFIMQQLIEGFNTADLGWGTANAKTVTLSFWVRSSLTGTFSGTFMNSAANRSYPFTYTINSANTWEFETITVAGDTTGTWVGATNGIGIRLNWNLGSGSSNLGTAGAWAGSELYGSTGSVSVVGTNGATFYITGVQFEVGSTATSFDYRPYTTELQLCQRYLPAFNATSVDSTGALAMGAFFSGTQAVVAIAFPVQTRVAPTGLTVSNGGHFQFDYTSSTATTALAIQNASSYASGMNITTVAGVSGQGGRLRFNNAAAQLLFTGCEL
jgi:hypothetical protein